MEAELTRRDLSALLGHVLICSSARAPVPKLTGGLEEMREHLEVAPWFWAVTALAEMNGAAGMLAGLKYPRLAVLAGLWLAAVMAGGIVAHLRLGDPPTDAIATAVLLALTVAALRRRLDAVDEPVAIRSRGQSA